MVAVGEAIREAHRACGYLEVVVIARKIEGAKVLKMKAKEATAKLF